MKKSEKKYTIELIHIQFQKNALKHAKSKSQISQFYNFFKLSTNLRRTMTTHKKGRAYRKDWNEKEIHKGKIEPGRKSRHAWLWGSKSVMILKSTEDVNTHTKRYKSRPWLHGKKNILYCTSLNCFWTPFKDASFFLFLKTKGVKEETSTHHFSPLLPLLYPCVFFFLRQRELRRKHQPTTLVRSFHYFTLVGFFWQIAGSSFFPCLFLFFICSVICLLWIHTIQVDRSKTILCLLFPMSKKTRQGIFETFHQCCSFFSRKKREMFHL